MFVWCVLDNSGVDQGVLLSVHVTEYSAQARKDALHQEWITYDRWHTQERTRYYALCEKGDNGWPVMDFAEWLRRNHIDEPTRGIHKENVAIEAQEVRP